MTIVYRMVSTKHQQWNIWKTLHPHMGVVLALTQISTCLTTMKEDGRGLGKCAINVLTVNELEKEDEQNSEELVEKTKRKRIQAQRIRLEEQAKWPLLDQEGKDDEEEFGVSSSEDNFCFYIAGTLLIMLLLNIFLWEMVASVPVYTSVSGYDGMSLKELLDHAVTESYNIRNLTAEMHRIFMEDVRYTPGRWFPERDLTACHTSALSVLIPKNRAQQFWGEFLLKETIGLLGAWNNPLHHITTELSHMEDAPNDIISKAKVIEGKIKELLMALKSILNKVLYFITTELLINTNTVSILNQSCFLSDPGSEHTLGGQTPLRSPLVLKMKRALCHCSSSVRADGWTAQLEARTESEANREKHIRE
ncbi:hypothetical protein ACRRTK_018261 [Alexandromys fortis]